MQALNCVAASRLSVQFAMHMHIQYVMWMPASETRRFIYFVFLLDSVNVIKWSSFRFHFRSIDFLFSLKNFVWFWWNKLKSKLSFRYILYTFVTEEFPYDMTDDDENDAMFDVTHVVLLNIHLLWFFVE